MGFAADTAFVTLAEVETITHEGNLARFDDGANATVANLLPYATNAIIRALKSHRGVGDPSKVTNSAEFKAAAAYWVVATIFGSQPQEDEENRAKAASYRAQFDKELKEVQIEEDGAGTDQATLGDKQLPRVFNHDAVGNFATSVDNRKPGSFPGPTWITKT